MFKTYKNPNSVGWLGWFEDGNVTAFVDLQLRVVFMRGVCDFPVPTIETD